MNHTPKNNHSSMDTKYLGQWTNTWKESTEIRKFNLYLEGEDLWMKIEDSLPANPNLNTAKVKSFTASPESKEVIAYQVKFDLQNMIADMSINYNKGILIIACFHKYSDKCSGNDYFTRQFYSRVGSESH